MKTLSLLFVGLALAATAAAQAKIPAGTVIPVELRSSINVNKSKPGQTITAKVAQDVPLYNGTSIKAGSRVTGEILTITPAQNSQPATIALRFDKVQVAGQMTPIVTNLRAIASPLEVDAAQTQTSGDDRGTSPQWSWTVPQIGGNDVVYREAETVDDGVTPVGKPVFAGNWGVLDKLEPIPGEPCRGAVAGNNHPQALWVFAHDACGVYGYDATIADAGREKATIVLASNDHGFQLRTGSALLLRVHGDGSSAPQDESASK
jgi:hypothetical protein